jgi:hypothetical protein
MGDHRQLKSRIKHVVVTKYSLSYENQIMTEKIARTLAGLILQLWHPSFDSDELIEKDRGVFHLFVQGSSRTMDKAAPAGSLCANEFRRLVFDWIGRW